jgi:hypothetical protein
MLSLAHEFGKTRDAFATIRQRLDDSTLQFRDNEPFLTQMSVSSLDFSKAEHIM